MHLVFANARLFTFRVTVNWDPITSSQWRHVKTHSNARCKLALRLVRMTLCMNEFVWRILSRVFTDTIYFRMICADIQGQSIFLLKETIQYTTCRTVKLSGAEHAAQAAWTELADVFLKLQPLLTSVLWEKARMAPKGVTFIVLAVSQWTDTSSLTVNCSFQVKFWNKVLKFIIQVRGS